MNRTDATEPTRPEPTRNEKETIMESVDIKTLGMHCGSCKMLVEMSVNELPGVSSAEVDLAGETTHVEFDPAQVTVDQILAAIKGAGYDAEVAA
jgi:P-type Cu+ transporter